MIDWYNLFANALWNFALALALATIGYARWGAKSRGLKLGNLLNLPAWQLPLNLAGVLFCVGLGLTSDPVWEQILWLVLGALFLLQIVLAAISMRSQSP
jgi:hypothetical protein